MGLPEPVEDTLCQIGGIEGLRQYLPPDEEVIRKKNVFSALSDPFRITILSLLSVQPLCVCIIREILQISDTRLSYHLKKLSSMGLINGTSQGNWIIYELTDLGRKALSLCSDHRREKK